MAQTDSFIRHLGQLYAARGPALTEPVRVDKISATACKPGVAYVEGDASRGAALCRYGDSLDDLGVSDAEQAAFNAVLAAIPPEVGAAAWSPASGRLTWFLLQPLVHQNDPMGQYGYVAAKWRD